MLGKRLKIVSPPYANTILKGHCEDYNYVYYFKENTLMVADSIEDIFMCMAENIPLYIEVYSHQYIEFDLFIEPIEIDKLSLLEQMANEPISKDLFCFHSNIKPLENKETYLYSLYDSKIKILKYVK